MIALVILMASPFTHPKDRYRDRNPAVVGIVMLVACSLMLASCLRNEKSLTGGAVVAGADLPGWRGDAAYAVVSSSAIPGLYQSFRDVLNAQGLVKWDSRFDCNRFAGLFIGVAQARYAAAAWHSETKAEALALAEVWYYPDAGGYHAIVQARTERGDVFIEPQTGKELNLTARELASVTLRKW